MTIAQLQLPFDLPEPTPLTLKDKSSSMTLRTKSYAKIKVEELQHPRQDQEMLRLGREFCDDVNLNEWVDPDILFMSCIRCRNDIERKQVNCWIAYADDEAIGFLVGVATPCFHRQGIVAEQKLCYVTPDRRGSTAAFRLIKQFEKWARINGATQIFTGSANLRHAERTIKLLETIGYTRVGALLVKEI